MNKDRRSQPTESQPLLRRSRRARQLSLQRWQCRRAGRHRRPRADVRRVHRASSPRSATPATCSRRGRRRQTELGLHACRRRMRTCPGGADGAGGPGAWCRARRAAASVPWWRQSTPVWMQAVAATVVFGAGLAIGTSGRGAATPAASAGGRSGCRCRRPPCREASCLRSRQRLRAELARLSAPAGRAGAGADSRANRRRGADAPHSHPGQRERGAPAARAGAAHRAGAARHRDPAQGRHGDGAAEHRADSGHDRRRAEAAARALQHADEHASLRGGVR